MDTGVWRGGTAAFAFGSILALNQSERKVWLIDRFRPISTDSLWSEFRTYILPRNEFALNEYKKASLSSVRHNFYWLNLLDTSGVARGGQGGRGGWGSGPNPGAASPQECSWGYRPQTPAVTPPQTPLGLRQTKTGWLD